ncbi:MAG TPA: hypothetical protein VMR51_01395 [Patescibacteria group bacterium]|nr:hypothetical protein [Patescibacteria group bacterium]
MKNTKPTANTAPVVTMYVSTAILVVSVYFLLLLATKCTSCSEDNLGTAFQGGVLFLFIVIPAFIVSIHSSVKTIRNFRSIHNKHWQAAFTMLAMQVLCAVGVLWMEIFM